MQEAKLGVMTHYLADWVSEENGVQISAAKWNELIHNFDVRGLARQLHSVNAGYYIITLGQNSGYYLAPNATFGKLSPASVPKLSTRDLVEDLYKELSIYGIRLIVYLPAGAPEKDTSAIEALGWKKGVYRNEGFQQKWEQIIKEWSLKWGDKVAGWWFDGCYWPNTMYRTEQAPNFLTFSAAARTGNPRSIVAFNPGVFNRTFSITPNEDYIAGEINNPELIKYSNLENGRVDGSQLHILSYLGETWGKGSPRFTTDEVARWSGEAWKNGGAITWDVPVQPDGLIPQAFIKQLKELPVHKKTK